MVQSLTQQIQDGGQPPSWKIEKSPYVGRRLTDFDETWHSDVFWPSWAFRPLKFQNFKNPRWRRPPYWKIEKSPYLGNGSADFDQTSTTWRIPLNRPCATAMRPIVKLFWSLVRRWNCSMFCQSAVHGVVMTKQALHGTLDLTREKSYDFAPYMTSGKCSLFLIHAFAQNLVFELRMKRALEQVTSRQASIAKSSKF